MIGSAAGIGFNTFVTRMWWPVLIAWLSILILFKYQFRRELAVTPVVTSEVKGEIRNPRVWYGSLVILAVMVVLFMVHHALHWQPWFIVALGMGALVFTSRNVVMDKTFEHVEIALLIFFIGLFVVIGGVEQSHLLEYLGQFIVPFVQ